jgi:hypothetical protein
MPKRGSPHVQADRQAEARRNSAYRVASRQAKRRGLSRTAGIGRRPRAVRRSPRRRPSNSIGDRASDRDTPNPAHARDSCPLRHFHHAKAHGFARPCEWTALVFATRTAGQQKIGGFQGTIPTRALQSESLVPKKTLTPNGRMSVRLAGEAKFSGDGEILERRMNDSPRIRGTGRPQTRLRSSRSALETGRARLNLSGRLIPDADPEVGP